MRTRPITLAAGLVLLLMQTVGGCGQRDFATEADLLRARALDLENEVQRLERRNRELVSELRQLRRDGPDVGELEESIAEHTPHPIDVTIGRLSHLRDRNADGVIDTLMLYLHPVDGRGRFTQLVGEVQVNVVLIPAEGQAITLLQEQVAAGDVRDAYRSGLTGTHYTLRLPIDLPDEVDVSRLDSESVVVRITYIDGLTGATRVAERAISTRR